MVAVNGAPVARLAALDSVEGTEHVGRELTRALAAPAAESSEPESGAPDVSISIDREVPWGRVERLLAMAHAAGARRAEILLTRGDAPVIPVSAPPEASWVLASDFVAVPVLLGAGGLSAPEDQRFGDVAPALVEANPSAETPVRVAVGR